MARTDRKQKEVTVYRYPVRFTRSELAVASNLLASTGIKTMGQLVHFAFAQLAKTAAGASLGAHPSATEPRTTDSDPELETEF